jgi:hypothetical protein
MKAIGKSLKAEKRRNEEDEMFSVSYVLNYINL